MDAVILFLNNGLLNWTWWQVLLATLISTHITIVAVTVFLHRSQAHRALDMKPILNHFFRFWLWLTTGMVTREWVAVHRKHHAKCERDGDPHSPVVFGIQRVLMQGAELYKVEAARQETLEKFGHGTPDDAIERGLYSRFTWHGCALLLIIDWLLFGVIGTTVWAVQMLWIPLLAAGVVNGIGHYLGYRNFNSPDASRNILPWGIIIGGEELHNNHHAYASSAKLSSRWYEVDIGWIYIRLFEILGLAKVRKAAHKPRLVMTKSACDLETLQAVITHRYEVMARYADLITSACRQEVNRLKETRGPWQLINRARTWLAKDDEHLPEGQKPLVDAALASSGLLKTLVEMRAELSAVWNRSSASSEQLLSDLQQWCAKAQTSRIPSLEAFALRLRSYSA